MILKKLFSDILKIAKNTEILPERGFEIAFGQSVQHLKRCILKLKGEYFRKIRKTYVAHGGNNSNTCLGNCHSPATAFTEKSAVGTIEIHYVCFIFRAVITGNQCGHITGNTCKSHFKHGFHNSQRKQRRAPDSALFFCLEQYFLNV